MADFSTVALLFSVVAIALFTVSIINRRQLRARLLSQKLKQMKRRANELEELSVTLEPMVENPRIARLVHNEATEILETCVRLAPKNAYFKINYETAEQRTKELADPARRVPIYRLMESDAAIARAQYALSEAGRIIGKQRSAEKLQDAEADALLMDLSWANFMVKVASNVGQGHKAVNRGDTLRALAFYRRALEVASEGNFKDPRKARIVSELGELLNNRRKALSTDLMPETIYNPGPDAPNLGGPVQKNQDQPAAG